MGTGPPSPVVRDVVEPTERTPVDGVSVLASLSPSRAADFTTCPLLYRFRTVDQLAEAPSREAVRGSLVHAVLERLFDLPAGERTPEAAQALLAPVWEELRETRPDLASLFAGSDPDRDVAERAGGRATDEAAEAAEAVEAVEAAEAGWLAGCRAALEVYFTLEDPRTVEAVERELYVETVLDSRLLLRGYVDRVDRTADGRLRVVDYKTGRSVGEAHEQRAFFQLKCYALALWRTTGELPSELELIYLGNGEVLRYLPDEADLRSTERRLNAVWAAIRYAEQTGDWRPRRGGMCRWCSHQSRCPEFGGTPPPLPVPPVPTADAVAPEPPG